MKSAYEKLLASKKGKQALFLEHAIANVTEMIATLLKENNKSQKWLAEQMNVSEGRITQILDGSSNLTLKTIATALGAFDQIMEVNARSIHKQNIVPLNFQYSSSWSEVAPSKYPPNWAPTRSASTENHINMAG